MYLEQPIICYKLEITYKFSLIFISYNFIKLLKKLVILLFNMIQKNHQPDECVKLAQIYVNCLNKVNKTIHCDEALTNYMLCINKPSNIILKKNNYT